MVTRRTLILQAYNLTGAAGYVAIVVSAVCLARAHPPMTSAPNAMLIGLAYIAGLAWAFGFLYLHWRKLDEAAREAHKSGWLIGGLVGIGLTAPPMMFMRISGAPFLADLTHGAGTPGLYFALGWAALGLAQVLGTLMAWAWWWIARR
jgi:hypothetical protein